MCIRDRPLGAVFVIDRRRDKALRAKQIRVRLAEPTDLEALPAIEKSGDVAFREVGMDLVADSEPVSYTHLTLPTSDLV